MTIAFEQTIPILRIFSLDKMREFYLDWLGFTVDWEHRFDADLPLYLQVSRAGLVLHLSEHHGDATPGSTVFIRMRGIAELHAELSAKKYRYARPGLETEPWGRTVTVGDPFGNHLRFCEKP
ncbi:MAG TPA: glyoxalase superfamily protein [Planctomycetota bacterium]|nr:glyoxalase superfamily protein [Planctomycetota bacterium]